MTRAVGSARGEVARDLFLVLAGRLGRPHAAGFAALVVFALAAGCSRPPSGPPAAPVGGLGAPAAAGPARAGDSLAADAERYVDIVLALRARDRDSVDFYAGPPERFAEAERRHLSLAAIRSAAVDLRDRLAAAAPDSEDGRDRREFMTRQLEAVVARVDLLAGKRFTFDEESRAFFGVTADDGDPTSAARARAELETLLPGRGSLAERYAAFDRRFLVPRDRLQAVLDRALQECRRVTREHLTLPDDESVSIAYTRLMPWSAYADYQGRGRTVIRVNLDYGLTVDRAFNLACHEAYPGHHTINTLIDTRLVGPLGRVELTVQPLFSPQSLRTEGAATYAPEVAFTEAERAAFEGEALFPIVGIDPGRAARYVRISRLVAQLDWHQAVIAREYIDGRLEFARAASALEDKALMISPDATLKFFNEFRSYALTYTVGRQMVERAVSGGAAGADARWRNYERWITSTR
ncbi:MAG: hypothetical protein IT176_01740 [Acidobacteria bacterium]|nr:hypothetical protein [Acidobacteriota bacterium]